MDSPGTQDVPLLEIRDLVVDYRLNHGIPGIRPAHVLRAVDHVSLAVRAGETHALVGESGSGKSSTGHAVLGNAPVTSGSVVFQGSDLRTLRRRDRKGHAAKIQFVFQDPYSSLDPRMSVRGIVGEPLRIHGVSQKDAEQRVRDAIDLVGLGPSQLDRRPHEFSGGQRQRIAIARALVSHPDFVVCDEPVSALDVSVQAQVLNLLIDLQKQRAVAYLFISHDLAVVRNIADSVSVMYLGRVVEAGSVTDLFARARHPYTHALLSAIPVPEPQAERKRRRIVLHGDPPSHGSVAAGCHFRDRCWLYRESGEPEVCRSEAPALTAVGPGHVAACHLALPLAAEPGAPSVLGSGPQASTVSG